MKAVFDMIILATILVLAVIVGCFAAAYRKVLASRDNGAREPILNGDVHCDDACRNHLILTNNEDPSTFRY